MTDTTLERPSPTHTSGATRRASLDGLRALAVTAVVLYHVDHTLVPGGFVGVDLFFVLSGYLITTLLVVEHGRSGSISLRAFWGRRVRRLWPLAWLTVGAVAIASLTGVWGPDRQRTLPSELTASIAQVANWYQIGHGGYVRDAVAPSPVRHFWSLAIEEQFYVFWPLVLAGVLAAMAATRRRWLMPAALGAMALFSIAAGLRVADSPDRAYLGTDVRLIALVVGASLAWALRGRPMRGPRGSHARLATVIAGTLGLLVLAGACVTLHADSAWLPRGGFLVIALASAGVIAFALSPTWLAAAVSWAPLVWLGRVSFAVYLVHWPLLVALGPGRSLGVRLLVAGPVTVAIAALLHRVLERPVIAGRVPPVRLASAMGALAIVSAVALVASVPTGRTPTERVEADLGRVPDPVAAPVPSPAPSAAADAAPTTQPCAPAVNSQNPDGAASPSERAVLDPSGATCAGQVSVMVVGDSTGRGVANGLVSLADPRVVVWDRTHLGCSFGGEDCPDWRTAWRTAIADVRPDVVVLFSGAVSDLRGVDDEPFLSPAESAHRAAALDEALAILSSGGADVLVTTPPVPLRPNGLFFCDGRSRDSDCDPRWVQRWTEDVRAAAARAGQPVIDTAGWVHSRGDTTSDRPDGLHLAGAALDAQAAWLVPQIVTAGTT